MTALAEAPTVASVLSSGGLATVRRRARRRRIAVAGVMLLLVVAVVVAAMAIGDYGLAPADLWRTLSGGGDRLESYVVFQVRAPRLVMGLLVGVCLGVAGALLQSLLGNPLASPDLLGVSSGSGAAAVLALVVFGASGFGLALAAFVGGLAVAAFLLLAGARRGDGGYRLILAGVGIAFLGVAVTGYLLTRAQVQLAQSAYVWLVGSLASTPWSNVLTVLAVAALAVPAVLACARWLPLVQLGRPTAASLGVPTGTVRVVAVVTAVVLTAVTCAFAGPISFIALSAPAIARPLLGHGAIALGTSAVIGATLLSLADLVAQYAIPGLTVPVGVVTGGVGAVFLLWLLATSKGRQL